MRFKIFDNYFLVIDYNTHFISVISFKRRIEKKLKPTVKCGMSYYRLYENGIAKEFSLETLVSKIDISTKITSFSH